MKKTLVALAVTSLVAASAQAVTVYDNEGTTVEAYGSVRLLLDNSKTESEGQKRAHTQLKNDGSRFGFQAKHFITEDFYALGRLELRFDKDASSRADAFGDVSTKRAYVGLGSKQYGQIAFGRQLTIGDDIARAGFDNTYGVTKTPLTTSGTAVVRYDYQGVEGLHVGADYRFAEKRDSSGEVLANELKNGYGVGAIYEFGDASVAAGYTRDNYKVNTAHRHYRDAVMAGASYQFGDLKLAADYGYSNDKNGSTRTGEHGLQVGAKYQFTPTAAVYGNYLYLNGNTKVAGEKTAKVRAHKYMLGSEYKFHKHVLAFVEGKIERITNHAKSGTAWTKDKVTDRSVGVGLRVFW